MMKRIFIELKKRSGKMDPAIIQQFDSNGNLVETNYWKSEMCQKGYYHLSFNNRIYSLLIPESAMNIMDEIYGTQAIVISKGDYKGKEGCFEILFDDNSDNPFMIILESEQVFFHPSKKDFGWNGCFYIYSGSLTDYKVYFRNVYYRITETLPFLQPPEDPLDYGDPLFKIEKQEHFEAHGDRW
jgi:hypothetical protein